MNFSVNSVRSPLPLASSVIPRLASPSRAYTCRHVCPPPDTSFSTSSIKFQNYHPDIDYTSQREGKTFKVRRKSVTRSTFSIGASILPNRSEKGMLGFSSTVSKILPHHCYQMPLRATHNTSFCHKRWTDLFNPSPIILITIDQRIEKRRCKLYRKS